jgi:alpha-glucosidase
MVNPKVRQELMEGDKCFLRHWMRPPYNIDGWRLDAIHMIGRPTAM